MEKEKKKIGCSYALLVIVLFATVCFLADYIVIDRKLNENKGGSSTDGNVSENVNNSGNDDNGNFNVKMDLGKDYVYDANYKIETVKDTYNGGNNHDIQINASDIIVPYININSGDAKKVNDELYRLYEELINDFNANLDLEIFYTTVAYDIYNYDNILSIVVVTTSGGTDVPTKTYYTYNFDLTNGNLLNYNDVLNKRNLNNNQIEQYINEYIDENISVENQTWNGVNGELNSKTETINNFNNILEDNKVNYYIENDNTLNLIVKIYFAAGAGYRDYIVPIN